MHPINTDYHSAIVPNAAMNGVILKTNWHAPHGNDHVPMRLQGFVRDLTAHGATYLRAFNRPLAVWKIPLYAKLIY